MSGRLRSNAGRELVLLAAGAIPGALLRWQLELAVRALHAAFGLDQAPQEQPLG